MKRRWLKEFDDDILYACGLVFLICLYLYPDTRSWTLMSRVSGSLLLAIVVSRYIICRRRLPLHGGKDAQNGGWVVDGIITESFPLSDTNNNAVVDARVNALVNPYSKSAPNVRNEFLSVAGQGCHASGSYGSASVLPSAQFCQSPQEPKNGVTDPSFQPPVPQSLQYRGMSTYANPEFILEDPSDPSTWISNKNNQNTNRAAPIPASQPRFYCQFDPDCNFQPLGEQWVSQNQNLVGTANPKTLIAPRIPTRLYDVNQWSEDPFVVFPQVNEQYDQELFQSGYLTTNSCGGKAPASAASSPPSSDTVSTTTMPREDYSKNYKDYNDYKDYNNSRASLSPEDAPLAAANPTKIPIEQIENENPGRATLQAYKNTWTLDRTIDTSMGYYPQNAQYNIPVNVPYEPSPSSACQKSTDEYNRRLGSIPLEPGVTTYSQVNQTDSMMSNLGISFTQPHLPTIPRQIGDNRVEYTEYDPLLIPRSELIADRVRSHPDGEVSRMDIYDPRLTGYGTSYRGYIDEMTGQPRFYYDDIEATTQYNYVSRNNIDFMPYGMQPGPAIAPQVCDWPSAMDVRQQANDTFANDVLYQRMNLQESLMRKNSHRERQRRMAPIHTMRMAPAGMRRQGNN